MSIQLSLAIPATTSKEQRLWLLSARKEHVPALRRYLQDGSGIVIDACTGKSAISQFDLVLLRVGDDLYEPYGCAGPLAALGHPGLLSASALAALASPHGQKGLDLLVAMRGSFNAQSDEPMGTPIESLFRLLRMRSPRLGLDARNRLCDQALATLDDDHQMLATLLRAQATRLERQGATTCRNYRNPVMPGQTRPGWIDSALCPTPVRSRPVLRDLFGDTVRDGAARDMSFDAFRVIALAIPIRETRACRDYTHFTAHAATTIDEISLSHAIGEVNSFRILVSAALDTQRHKELTVQVDYEVRQRFQRLTGKSARSDVSHLRLEDSMGHHLTSLRPARFGEVVRFALPDEWIGSDSVKGYVAYTAGDGAWARQAVNLSVAI